MIEVVKTTEGYAVKIGGSKRRPEVFEDKSEALRLAARLSYTKGVEARFGEKILKPEGPKDAG